MREPHTFLDHLLRRFSHRSLVSAIADGVERAAWRLGRWWRRRKPIHEPSDQWAATVDEARKRWRK